MLVPFSVIQGLLGAVKGVVKMELHESLRLALDKAFIAATGSWKFRAGLVAIICLIVLFRVCWETISKTHGSVQQERCRMCWL